MRNGEKHRSRTHGYLKIWDHLCGIRTGQANMQSYCSDWTGIRFVLLVIPDWTSILVLFDGFGLDD